MHETHTEIYIHADNHIQPTSTTQTHIYAYIHTYTPDWHIHSRRCIHLYIQTNRHTEHDRESGREKNAYTLTHIYIMRDIYTYKEIKHTYTYTYIYIYIHRYTHTYIHTYGFIDNQGDIQTI